MSDIFKHLLVLGRPACGKSEFIDFLKHAPAGMRRERLHIGAFEEVDDFPWLWEKFQDDALWVKAGYERLYTEEYMPGNPGMAPKGAKLFDWCMHKFNEVIGAQYLPRDEFYRDHTLLIEFSRGGADGFRRALGMLDPAVLAPGRDLPHPRVARGIVAAQRRALPGEAEALHPGAHGAARDLRLLLRRQRLGRADRRQAVGLDRGQRRARAVRHDEQRAGVDRPGGARGALRGRARHALGAEERPRDERARRGHLRAPLRPGPPGRREERVHRLHEEVPGR